MDHRDLAQARLPSTASDRGAVESLAEHVKLSWSTTPQGVRLLHIKGRVLSNPSVKPTLSSTGPTESEDPGLHDVIMSRTRVIDLCLGPIYGIYGSDDRYDIFDWRRAIESYRCTLRVMASHKREIKAKGETPLWVFFLPLFEQRLPGITFDSGDPGCARKPRRIVFNVECHSDPLRPLHESVLKTLLTFYWYMYGAPSPDVERLENVIVILTRPVNQGETDGLTSSWDDHGESERSLVGPPDPDGIWIAEPYGVPSTYLRFLQGHTARLQFVGLEQFLPTGVTAHAYLQDLAAFSYHPAIVLEALTHEAFKESLDAQDHRLFTVK